MNEETTTPGIWNTLRDAAAWLNSQDSATKWTPRRIADVMVRMCMDRVEESHRAAHAAGIPRGKWLPSNPHTPLVAGFPPETEFIQHEVSSLASGAPQPIRIARYPVHLRIVDIQRLLLDGAILKGGDVGNIIDSDGNRIHVIEFKPPPRITLEEVRMRESDLLDLAASAILDRQPAQATAQPQDAAAKVQEVDTPVPSASAPAGADPEPVAPSAVSKYFEHIPRTLWKNRRGWWNKTDLESAVNAARDGGCTEKEIAQFLGMNDPRDVGNRFGSRTGNASKAADSKHGRRQ